MGYVVSNVPVEPEPLQLGEDVERLELLQVEDLGVGQPELLDEVDVDGDPGVGAVDQLQGCNSIDILNFGQKNYRVTHLVSENLPLSWVLGVPSSCLGSK